jgi:hypothetical protein
VIGKTNLADFKQLITNKNDRSVLSNLNELKAWHAATIISIIGIIVYFSNLRNPFQGDDYGQIVDNVPVHSIKHIGLFFQGGTFYNGQGLAHLGGQYYRPLMMTMFSLLYSLFGAHSFYFHLLQLAVSVGSSVLLYLFFRYSFSSSVSLILAIIFLIHPIDSQTVIAIPSLQDALFFFFGILALWLLIRFQSIKSLPAVCISLFLCLLSKESAVLFILISVIYLLWWSRERLVPFLSMLFVPVLAWIFLRIHAVGIDPSSINAPIDRIGLKGRLLTDPSILLMYLTKFVLPIKLASSYYWIHTSFSIRYVLMPLLVDILVVGAIIYVGLTIKKRSSKANTYTFAFFAIWTALGLLLNLQIVPLDFTASDPWFYFPMAGLLGMIGVCITVFKFKIRFDEKYIFIGTSILIILLGTLTILRTLDWTSQYKLATKDIAASSSEYIA